VGCGKVDSKFIFLNEIHGLSVIDFCEFLIGKQTQDWIYDGDRSEDRIQATSSSSARQTSQSHQEDLPLVDLEAQRIRVNRRQILDCHVTKHPTSLWIVQQLRETFPFELAPQFLIFDRDGKYGVEVAASVRSLKSGAVRTSFENLWQNGAWERWVESCRRDLLDHIIRVNEHPLKRLLSNYVYNSHGD
jgi:hypothetical protein